MSPTLQVSISRDPQSGWWKIVGPDDSGIYIANPSLQICLQDIEAVWRYLAENAPEQVPPFPGESSGTQ